MQERNRFIFQNRSRRSKLIDQRRIGGIEPPLFPNISACNTSKTDRQQMLTIALLGLEPKC